MKLSHRHIVLSLLLSASLPLAAAEAPAVQVSDFEGIRVEVRGAGRPVLMIPGLNSAGAVWKETCDALIAAKVQCHIVQLPGFAGQPAQADEAFLTTQRDRLLRYVKANHLKQPIAMGHSLGGVLSLMMARAEPQSFSQLVIVDSLPFFPAATNPSATETLMAPIAKGMREGMLKATDEVFAQQTEAASANLTNQKDRIETLKTWGRTSDRGATTQAMFELFSIDLRGAMAEVHTPTLVLGSWAAYAAFGSSRDSTYKIFADQYAKLDGVRIEMSGTGYHFLMWDDQDWLVAQVKGVL